MNLRGYQERIVQSVLGELENYTGAFVLEAVQGAGKSIMIAELVKRLGEPVLILCMSKELVEQDAEKLKKVGVEPTIYSASCGQKVMSDITVATIGSIYKHPEYCQHFKVVIIDECDAVPTEDTNSMYMKLLGTIGCKVVGWTGTPFRTLKEVKYTPKGKVQRTMIKPLTHKYWTKIIHGVGFKELLELGYLSPVEYYNIKCDNRVLRVNSTGLDYTKDSLNWWVEQNYNNILKIVAMAGNGMSVDGELISKPGEHILITLPDIESAELIADKLKELGWAADTLHSKVGKKERTEKINKFKSGQTQIMCQVMVLNIGFDFPELDTIIFARPSRSLRVWSQIVGRGVRICDHPKTCKVWDMGGMLNMFGRVEYLDYRNGIKGDTGRLDGKVLGEVNITEIIKLRSQ